MNTEDMKQLSSQPETPTQFTNLAPHYDELMDMVPYDAWVEYVLLLLEIAQAKPKTILDCACGTGNVSFELAAHGYEVTGVDLSQDMVVAAKEKLQQHEAPLFLHFEQADLTNFNINRTFDAATCLYDSLNYILDPAQLEAAFVQIARHIVPGGVFVFDMNAPWAFEANLFTQQSKNPRKRLHYKWNADFNKDTRICDVTMLFERQTEEGLQKFSEVHRERAYSLDEVTAMLERSGWQLLKTYDAYTLNPPHRRSERWYFLAKRVE